MPTVIKAVSRGLVCLAFLRFEFSRTKLFVVLLG